jgi:hypothetical protein
MFIHLVANKISELLPTLPPPPTNNDLSHQEDCPTFSLQKSVITNLAALLASDYNVL